MGRSRILAHLLLIKKKRSDVVFGIKEIKKVKMKTQKHRILGLLLMTGLATVAQTSNFGELSIFPNTQMSIVGDFNNTPTGTVMNDGELIVHSDFNNDGLFTYFDSANNGLTRFEGTGVQQITGAQPTEFYNVLFNNTASGSALELIGDISIVNTAEFFRGIVKNDNLGGRIEFERFADHRNTSDASHVDGQVYKNGDTAFEFPIGDSGFYRKAAISVPDTENDVFVFQYFLENSNAVYPHKMATGVIETIDDAEYWMISREQGSSDIIVTLSWNDDATPAAITTGPTSAIHVVRWDEQQGFWIDEGGIVNEGDQTVTTITNVSGYGIFTLARVKEEIILPGNIVVYNAISPNDDTQNSFFFIQGIANFPNNTVRIYNRWGVKVYETTGYNETDNVFTGFSDGRATINKDGQLPTGTYFYVLNYEYNDGTTSRTVKKAGYLYINKDE